MKVIYVAGPFRGVTEWDIECNCRHASEISHFVWKHGAVALCPHMNSRWMHGSVSDSLILDGTMELMKRCDAVFVADGWRDSEGTKAEIAEAVSLEMPVFFWPSDKVKIVNWILTDQAY